MRKRGYIRCAALVMSLALASGMGLTGCGHKNRWITGWRMIQKLQIQESFWHQS